MEQKYISHIVVCDFLELVALFAKHIMLQNDFSYAIAAYYGRENGRGDNRGFAPGFQKANQTSQEEKHDINPKHDMTAHARSFP